MCSPIMAKRAITIKNIRRRLAMMIFNNNIVTKLSPFDLFFNSDSTNIIAYFKHKSQCMCLESLISQGFYLLLFIKKYVIIKIVKYIKNFRIELRRTTMKSWFVCAELSLWVLQDRKIEMRFNAIVRL